MKLKQEMENDLLEYRKKHFAVRVEKERYQRRGIDLSITHNGSHWNTINLLPDEAKQVIETLNEYLETKND